MTKRERCHTFGQKLFKDGYRSEDGTGGRRLKTEEGGSKPRKTKSRVIDIEKGQ